MAEFFATYYLRRRSVKKIKESGAISENTAKAKKELGIDESILKWLVLIKDIRKTADDRYYVACKDEKHC